jgi:hypothetical protein
MGGWMDGGEEHQLTEVIHGTVPRGPRKNLTGYGDETE